MAHDIIIRKLNESQAICSTENVGILYELSENLSFYVSGYKFMPAFKSKMWDGKIRLFDKRNGTFPAGLIGHVLEYLNRQNYSVNADIKEFMTSDVTEEMIDNFLDNEVVLNKKYEIRDYQRKAVKRCLLDSRTFVLSATGSGKSLIIYLIFSFIREYLLEEDQKMMLIVPSLGLIEQMEEDFNDYSDGTYGKVHKIKSGAEKSNFSENTVISTWQSASKIPALDMLKYGVVIGDEGHLFKAKSLTDIMNKLQNAKIRVGTSGSLDGTKVMKLQLIGLFGPIFIASKSAELIERGILSKMNIKGIVLKHSKFKTRLNYQDEINYIISHEKRNQFIKNLALSLKGNTLILFQRVEDHGEQLYNLIKKKNKSTFYIHGGVKGEERNAMRAKIEKLKKAIVVASVGTTSTGVNIKNIHNIIFASPTKSQIRVLQSIGRGLRQSTDGQALTVYDLIDKFASKRENFAFKHGQSRIEIYENEKFPYTISEIVLD